LFTKQWLRLHQVAIALLLADYVAAM